MLAPIQTERVKSKDIPQVCAVIEQHLQSISVQIITFTDFYLFKIF